MQPVLPQQRRLGLGCPRAGVVRPNVISRVHALHVVDQAQRSTGDESSSGRDPSASSGWGGAPRPQHSNTSGHWPRTRAGRLLRGAAVVAGVGGGGVFGGSSGGGGGGGGWHSGDGSCFGPGSSSHAASNVLADLAVNETPDMVEEVILLDVGGACWLGDDQSLPVR